MAKTTAKQRRANRDKVRRWREKQKFKAYLEQEKNTVTNVSVTPEIKVTRDTSVTNWDIEMLPPSLKFQLEAETRARKVFKMSDNLRQRQEAMVRRFRGY